MATRDIDTLLHIYHRVQNASVGQYSPYTEITHLGTLQTIKGWRWDERYWPTDDELEAIALAPSVWDAYTTRITDSYFQSGYGDNNDLLLMSIERMSLSGDEVWVPKVHTGYFYSQDQEWYLYSDWYQSHIMSATDVVSGLQFIDLEYQYKPTYPIQVRQYSFNIFTGEHSVELDFRKIVEFTVSGTDPEFMVDNTNQPPRIWLNDVYAEEVGTTVTYITSGVADPSTLNTLELMGLSNGAPSQAFHFDYSPIDPSQDVEIYTFITATDVQEWDVISGTTPFASGENYQVRVDADRGILQFGDFDDGVGYGAIPPAGVRVGAHYTKGLAVMYEPLHARDYVLAANADVNPIEAPSNRGFVQVSAVNQEPAYVNLTVSGVTPGSDGLYETELGNNTEKLVATVKDINGNVIEGVDVVFFLLAPAVGAFGSESEEISAATDSRGQAIVRYNTPLTIDDVGRATASLTYPEVGKSLLILDGLLPPDSLSGLWTYQVRDDDPTMGIPEDEVSGLYTDFLTEEDIVSGVTADYLWEQDHRTIHEVGIPVVSEPTALEEGTKLIMLTSGSSVAVDPHDGDYDPFVFTPVYPSEMELLGTDEEPELRLTYDYTLPSLVSGVKSYFVVGDNRSRVQAYTQNNRTNEIIYSNIIGLKIIIPEEANGTFFAEQLTDVESGLLTAVRNVLTEDDADIDATSGIQENWDAYMEERTVDEQNPVSGYRDWFRRTRLGDTLGLIEAADLVPGLDPGLPLVTYVATGEAEIPLGFRLKSPGITVASILDQVVYLDPNDHLPSGYFDS